MRYSGTIPTVDCSIIGIHFNAILLSCKSLEWKTQLREDNEHDTLELFSIISTRNTIEYEIEPVINQKFINPLRKKIYSTGKASRIHIIFYKFR